MARVRRLAGQRRVGHAGTLDPMATGVLPVLLGRATRLADFIHQGRKTYRATIALGTATETDDAEGSPIARAPVPALSPARLEAALGQFRGDILQRPPAYSALKVAGQRAYAVARRGQAVDLASRPVTIAELRLLAFADTSVDVEVTCSKGTYIRALARDLAGTLGTVGHLSALMRTRVGPFSLENATTLAALAAPGGIAAALLSADRTIPDAPASAVTAADAAKLTNGQPVGCPPTLHADTVWIYDPCHRLVCLASAEAGWLRPRLAL